MIKVSELKGQYLFSPTLKDKELAEALESYPEFQYQNFYLGKIIRYIILMYDIGNSEIQSMYPEYMTRKRECALMAGFKMKEYRFSTDVEDILVCNNPDTNKMIIRYVRLFNNPDYVAYVSYWEMLVSEMLASMETSDSKVLKVIRDNISKLREELNQLSDNIFRGDSTHMLRKALYAEMESEKLHLRPEHIAKQIKEGDLKLEIDPYYAST